MTSEIISISSSDLSCRGELLSPLWRAKIDFLGELSAKVSNYSLHWRIKPHKYADTHIDWVHTLKQQYSLSLTLWHYLLRYFPNARILRVLTRQLFRLRSWTPPSQRLKSLHSHQIRRYYCSVYRITVYMTMAVTVRETQRPLWIAEKQ